MLFDILLLGLSEFLSDGSSVQGSHGGGEYPHPELLCEAMNRLSLAFLVSEAHPPRFPRTLHGLIEQCHRPAGDWWPRIISDQDLVLPSGFERVPLLEDGKLSEEANERLYDALEAEDLPEHTSSRTKKSGLENALMRELIRKLRAETEPPRMAHANQEYQWVRRFLIEHPLPTVKDVRRLHLRNGMRLISAAEIGAFYDERAGSPPLWICEKCGPLLFNKGQLVGLKPEACGDHWPTTPHVHKIEGDDAASRWRLKTGLQLRTLIPGVPELDLFNWIEQQRQAHPNVLCDVTLWPGIDRYDYRLRWSDGEVWGVDFKDYKSPENLGRKLKALPNQDAWIHDLSFYVFPSRHLTHNPDYQRLARSQAKDLSHDVQLLSDTEFQQRVGDRLAQLSKAARARPSRKAQPQGTEDSRDV